jgi:hypothetical protein
MAGRESSSSSNVGKATTSEEDRLILVILGDALRYADEVDGLVPTHHIDHAYNLVVTHIKSQGPQEKESPSRKRQKGTGKRRNTKDIYTLKPKNYLRRTRGSWQNW